MRKWTFGPMQKVLTQTINRVFDAASDQGQHFLTLFLCTYGMYGIYTYCSVNTLITCMCFQYRIRADLGLHYDYCLVTLVIWVKVTIVRFTS